MLSPRNRKALILSVTLTLLLPVSLALAQTAKALQQIIVLNLRIRGFEPSQVTVKAGEALLIVENHSGHPSTTIRVSSAQGLPVTAQGLTQLDVASHGQSPHSTAILNLKPGTYTISEAGQPKWTCSLTVQ